MKKYFSALLLAITAVCTLSSCAKDELDIFSTIHGIVTDDATADCIPGATVTLSPGGKTQTTGSDGRYQFSEIDPMQYTVTVQKPGYNTNRKMITVVSGEATEANVTLHKIDQ